MTDIRTTFAAFDAARTVFAPAEKAMQNAVHAHLEEGRKFIKENSFYTSENKYEWIESSNNYTYSYSYEDSFYFVEGWNEESITLDELENIVDLLKAEYDRINAEKTARDKKYKKARKKALKAELKALDS